jgi:fumarate reductase flavoprotein subunit
VGLIGNKHGEDMELRSRATIISTGGFSANKELVKKYIGPHADRCKLRGTKQDTGDGLKMALAVGAKAVNLKYFYGHLIARKALSDDRFWPYPRLDSFVDEGILIDADGKRFVDEGRGDVAVANDLSLTNEPTGATLIFDHESWSASKDSPSSTSLKIPSPNPWILDNGGEIYTQDTAEGLAQLLGVNLENLKRTVEDYNNAVNSWDRGSVACPSNGKTKNLARAALRLASRPRHHLHDGWHRHQRSC